jgi:hypothetical protein
MQPATSRNTIRFIILSPFQPVTGLLLCGFDIVTQNFMHIFLFYYHSYMTDAF